MADNNLKRQAHSLFGVLAAFAAIAMPAVALGVVVEDFEGAFNWTVYSAAARGQSAAQAAAPSPRGNSARFAWQAQHYSLLESSVSPAKALPVFARGVDGTVSMDVYGEAPEGVSRFTLRLLDANGEVFQWRVPASLARGEWRTVDFVVRRETSSDHWPRDASVPGSNDGVIDLPATLFGVVVELRDAYAGSIYLDNIRAATPGALQGVTVEVETGSSIRILRPGQESNLALRVRNTTTQSLAFQMTARLADYYARETARQRSFDLAAGAEELWPLPTPAYRGIYWVKYALTDAASGAERYGRTSFVYMDPAGPSPGKAAGFLFSICTHTERWSAADQDLEAEALAACGAKVARTGVEWGGIQPSAGVWQWSTMDRLVDIYEQRNVEIQYLLAYTPKWAAPPDRQSSADWLDWARAMPDLTAWGQYVSTIANRYKDRIRFWEVWNEADGSYWWRATPADYHALIQRAYAEIKQTDPALRVMTTGFTNMTLNPSFVQSVALNDRAFYDILAMHIHGSFPSFQGQVDGALAALRAQIVPAKPLYFNETAFYSNWDEQWVQAETLAKKLAYAWARGAMGYTWYDLRNDGDNPGDAEHNYGLLTRDFHPKAAYPVYNTLARLLGGMEFRRQLDLGAQRYGLVFGGPLREVVVLWSDAPGALEEDLGIPTTATRALRVDLMDNRAAAPLAGGQATARIGPTPNFLLLEWQAPPARVKYPWLYAWFRRDR